METTGVTCSLSCMTCVSKSLSDLDAEPLDEALLADEGREGVDPGLAAGLDLAAPRGKQNEYTVGTADIKKDCQVGSKCMIENELPKSDNPCANPSLTQSEQTEAHHQATQNNHRTSPEQRLLTWRRLTPFPPGLTSQLQGT